MPSIRHTNSNLNFQLAAMLLLCQLTLASGQFLSNHNSRQGNANSTIDNHNHFPHEESFGAFLVYLEVMMGIIVGGTVGALCCFSVGAIASSFNNPFRRLEDTQLVNEEEDDEDSHAQANAREPIVFNEDHTKKIPMKDVIEMLEGKKVIKKIPDAKQLISEEDIDKRISKAYGKDKFNLQLLKKLLNKLTDPVCGIGQYDIEEGKVIRYTNLEGKYEQVEIFNSLKDINDLIASQKDLPNLTATKLTVKNSEIYDFKIMPEKGGVACQLYSDLVNKYFPQFSKLSPHVTFKEKGYREKQHPIFSKNSSKHQNGNQSCSLDQSDDETKILYQSRGRSNSI